jgi:hypothetical protein
MLFRKFFSWLVISALLAPASVPPAAAQTVVRAGTTAVPWASNISCSPGQFVAASPDNLHVFKAVNLTPGTAANTQPTWNIFSGAITVDGSCAWQEQGTLGLPGSGGVQSGPPQTLTNCTAAGTTLNEGVEFSTQLINGVTSLCGTTAAAGSISVVGVCQTGCGNAGAAQIAYSGYQPGIFDNQTTQNDYVIPSATNPGQFTDIGATVPASTTENVGIVASTNTGPGTIATIFLAPLSLFARGSSGGSGVVNPPGCANGIAYYPGLGAVISSDCNFTTNGQGDFIAHSGTFNDILHAGYVNFIQGPAPPSRTSHRRTTRRTDQRHRAHHLSSGICADGLRDLGSICGTAAAARYRGCLWRGRGQCDLVRRQQFSAAVYNQCGESQHHAGSVLRAYECDRQ